MTGETPEVRSDKRKSREDKQNHRYNGSHRYHREKERKNKKKREKERKREEKERKRESTYILKAELLALPIFQPQKFGGKVRKSRRQSFATNVRKP